MFFESTRTYEDFRNQVSPTILPIFEELRMYCLALEKNVIEDVRQHRVVMCKSFTFRWFADLEPQENQIIIKIQKSRKKPPTVLTVSYFEEIAKIKNLLKTAYEEIH